MTEWKTYRIHQLQQPNGLVGGPFGSSLGTRDYVAAGVPVIRGTNLSSDKRFDVSEFVFVSEKKAHELSRNIAMPGDVIFTQRGTLGQVGLIPASPYKKYIVSQSQMRLRVNPELATAEYIYYAFRTSDMIAMIENHAIVSGVPHINLGILADIEITIPPVEEQHRIATLLSALDSKINQNREINHTLEAMASSLFKTWFVDFDPVVAKAAGRKPFAMDNTTAALFPDSFQEVAGQSIPSGWSICVLGDLIELKRGFDLPAHERRPGKIPIVSSSGFSGTHSKAMIQPPGIVTGRYGTIGQVYYVDEPFWPLNTTLFVDKYKSTFSWFAYHCLSRVDFYAYADKAAVPGINRNHVHAEPVICPPIGLQERFHQFTETLWHKMKHNQIQNRLLAEMRDILLPKLISGEIRLRDAEKLVGEAA